MTTGRHESCATVGLHRYGADIRPQACMEAAHCGVTPLWCRHTTTGMHGSCTTVALHCYGADIRPQACMEAAPLWRYTAMMQTYDHRHALRLRHCGVMPLWCRNRAVVLHAHQYDAKLDMLLEKHTTSKAYSHKMHRETVGVV